MHDSEVPHLVTQVAGPEARALARRSDQVVSPSLPRAYPLAVKRAQGVRLGRPSSLPAKVVARILAARAGGASLRAIAADLTADNVPTATGGKWHASTVRVVLDGQDAARLRAQAATADV